MLTAATVSILGLPALDLTVIDKDYRRVITGNSSVANALVGVGYEFGDGSKLRWTNLYIRDTLKQSRLGDQRTLGTDDAAGDENDGAESSR